MEELKTENKKLREFKQSCEEELQKLREIGQNHENQIDTLLKFNERLLGIIENEFNATTKSKINSDLQIINEANEKESELASPMRLKNKLSTSSHPERSGNNFESEEGNEEQEDDQEDVYYNPAIETREQLDYKNYQATQLQNKRKNLLIQVPKINKSAKVFEAIPKDEQVSIMNLTNSVQTNSDRKNNLDYSDNISKEGMNVQPQSKHLPPNTQEFQMEELKELIKEYNEEFVMHSGEYQHICAIMYQDLIKDAKELKKVQDQTNMFFKQQEKAVANLKQEIKNFKPVNQLIKAMKKLKVPIETERLLNARIVKRYTI